MAMIFQSHSKPEPAKQESAEGLEESVPQSAGDMTVGAEGDFGYLFPPSGNSGDYLPESSTTVDDLDELGNLMIGAPTDPTHSTSDAPLPPVFTYWGQFLDHELTARTDGDSVITNITNPTPDFSASDLEVMMKNARTPAFDLDSVYGGTPVGHHQQVDMAKVVFALRHPILTNKMRVGTANDSGNKPDGLDPHRDLPRFSQVSDETREAAVRLAASSMTLEELQAYEESLEKRALIGDMRNDENLIVAQFHVSVLRFHNRVVDFLENNDTGWIADFHSAQTLTRLHYQWLAIEGYLKGICDPSVVQSVLDSRAELFYQFRAAHRQRNPHNSVGNALPFEFSVAAFRFGHTMVRNEYDYNANFGRPGNLLPTATFSELFNFTGAGGMRGDTTLPENWIIDWSRFVGSNPMDDSDGRPGRNARTIDTQLAPKLGDMTNAGNEHPSGSDLGKMFKHLARRNLRRGYNLRLPSGQALHRHLKTAGAVSSDPISNVSSLFAHRPKLQEFLQNNSSNFDTATPLWFYCLAEAEAAGGTRLGEVGSWIVASTFIGVMLDDQASALSTGFTPNQSPLKMPDGSAIDSIEKWMKFALVME